MPPMGPPNPVGAEAEGPEERFRGRRKCPDQLCNPDAHICLAKA